MSKSKGNVVIPDKYVKKYGADTLRMYLMFLGPFNQGGDFYDTGIEGMFRFLNRVWRLFSEATLKNADQNVASNATGTFNSAAEKRRSANIGVYDQRESASVMHKTIKKVTEDISNLRYNTAIATLMTYYNFLSKQKDASKEEAENFLKLLAPFAPHMTEELWSLIKADQNAEKRRSASISVNNQRQSAQWSIHCQPWPSYDPKFLVEDEVTIVVQINGKLRDIVIVTDQASKNKNTIEQLAKESDKVKKHLDGKSIKKVVYVVGKVINFVIDGR
jgi:leucyl-tRNA synthetase